MPGRLVASAIARIKKNIVCLKMDENSIDLPKSGLGFGKSIKIDPSTKVNIDHEISPKCSGCCDFCGHPVAVIVLRASLRTDEYYSFRR